MPQPGYAELHLHTCYSFIEAASQPEELAVRAAELGYSALAITDHDGLHGAMAFAQACAAANIRPITGVELTLTRGLVADDVGPVHLTLLAENRHGYANLCRLVTEAHQQTRNGRVATPPALDPSFLDDHTQGLIALSGCREGEVARLLDARRFQEAALAARRLRERFSPNGTYLELMQNLVRGDTARVARLTSLAVELDLPVVATGDVHYHDRARHRLQDALVAIKHRTTLEASHLLRRPNSRFYLRPLPEVARVFADQPEAIRNAGLIAERCRDFNLADHRDLGYDFPDFVRQGPEQGASADEVLAAHCWRQFAERYAADGTPPEIEARARVQLAAELKLIAKHHLAGFFLIYRDLQQLATDVAREVRGTGTVRGGSGLPPGRGRGSSVSSIVCYLIGLSHVCPIRNRLFFRRFLNEDLKSIPDIDLDFARDIRAELILQVHERYGREHAALVCSFATYHLRSAVRDLGKVLGLPPGTIDKLAKLSEGHGANTVRHELELLPELRGETEGPLWGMLVELATQIDGMPRHISQHVGGMIISSRPLIEMVPVQPSAMEGRRICQWDKDSCDDARFVKIDFLALGMLSLVEECLELIWQTRGEKVDLGAISYDDPSVYDMICEGDTVGLFQVESRAQIQMLTRTQPRNLDDLAVQVAIVRPGPIVGGAVNPYVRRRERLRQDPTYRPRADHPRLDALLADTLGVVLYQDQVLEVAMELAGFSAGQADQLRRAMSRKRSHEAMARFGEEFLRGAVQRGVSERDARGIFDKLVGFSEFGFPKSHAYAFAVLAYQSAWLRSKYPAEYYCGLLNNQPMGFYAPHVLVGDARRHGITVLPVAINRGAAKATPGDHSLLLGLTAVKGLGEDLARAIVAERTARGLFQSLGDLLRRTALSRTLAERLIAVGALAEFGLGRRELLWQLGLLLPATAEASRRGHRRLDPDLGLPVEQDMVALPDMDRWERLVAEYGLLGLSPAHHPLGYLRARLPRDVRTAAALREGRDGAWVRTAGLVVCRQRPGTARGFVFLLLEDETGFTNVVVRPDLYDAQRSLIRGEPYLLVEGRLQLRSGTLNVLATNVASMTRVPGSLLPRPLVEGAAPENPNPHEQISSEPDAPLLAASGPRSLIHATPSSHDFH